MNKRGKRFGYDLFSIYLRKTRLLAIVVCEKNKVVTEEKL